MATQTAERSVGEMISSIVGVGIQSVNSILALVRGSDLSTIDQCRAVIGNEFATKREKNLAEQQWAALSEAAIDKANSFDAVVKAFCYGQAPNRNKRLMKLGAEKLAKFAKEPWQFTHKILGSGDLAVPNDIKEMVNAIYRKRILELTISLKNIAEMWKIFAGTSDQAQMEERITALVRARLVEIEKLDDDEKQFALDGLYHTVPTAMAELNTDVRTLWTAALDEAGLRHVWEYFTKEEERKTKEKSGGGYMSGEDKKSLQMEILKIQTVLKIVEPLLDDLYSIAVGKMETEAELLGALKKADEPQLPKSNKLIFEKLAALWERELSKKDLPFERAMEIFSEIRNTVRYDASATKVVSMAYQAMRRQIRTSDPEHKARAAAIMEKANHWRFEKASFHLWLKFRPTLKELMKAYEEIGPKCRNMLLTAIIKEANSFEKALFAFDTKEYVKESRFRLVGHVATKIGSHSEGMIALKKMGDQDRYEGRRAIVLKATLRFVTTEDQLELIAKCLGRDQQKPEQRLLVEKALELQDDATSEK